MESDESKIESLKSDNWITWRDMVLALLESKDLLSCIHEGEEVPTERDANELRATFVIKKNVSKKLYYLVRNLKRPGHIWRALNQYFVSNTKRNIQTRRRSMREITIESCFFEILSYFLKTADAADELVALDVKINDSAMCDAILEGLETDFRLTDFLFFQSTQDNNDYYKLISDIKVYVNSPSFKIKYGRKKKKAYTSITTRKTDDNSQNKNDFHCDYCGKDGHTEAYCWNNPKSKKIRKPKTKKPDVALHVTQVSNRTDKILLQNIIIDSAATSHFFGNRNMFIGIIKPYSGELECASGTLPITGIETVGI